MTHIEINEPAVGEFMRTPDGPVARRMMVVGEAVKTSVIAALKPGFPKDFLGPYIVKRTVNTDHGPAVMVGSMRTRTKPHIIVGNPLLVFFWPTPKGPGKTVFLPLVHHPGSDFGPYLERLLIKALEETRGV